ncbi:PspC domain-containing protein [Pimelobacter sp. 30-1]|uniref:PspC domain-containing protein n=1 Tax=Pimelobacter sp. 30-1 TaxID=2004991 RepID=UPI001C051404|nr:PspC domain-containing protein [Pimelobacter sp. 30-1]
MNAPTDTASGPTGPNGEPREPREPGDTGPRVTRDEVRDLARLRRSRDDRKVAGVAAGVARHLDIDPLLVRVAFVVLTFFGGGGLILYAVGWLLVPEEGTEDTVIRLDEGVRTAALVVAGVVAVAAVIGDTVGGPDFPWPLMAAGLVLIVVLGGRNAAKSGRTHPWLRTGPPVPPPPPPAPGTAGYPATYSSYRPTPPPPPRRPANPRKRGPLLFPFTFALTALAVGIVATIDLAGADVLPSVYPATVLGVVGVMLLVGAFYGRAGGLILIGLVAAVATAATATVDRLEMGQTKPPITESSQLKSSYELGVGEIVIDLRKVTDLENLDGRTLDLDLDVGHIEVIVPKEGLTIEATGDVDAGEVLMFGKNQGNEGRGGHLTRPDDPTLTVDAQLKLGQIEFRSAA